MTPAETKNPFKGAVAAKPAPTPKSKAQEFDRAKLIELAASLGIPLETLQGISVTICSIVPDTKVSQGYYHGGRLRHYTIEGADPVLGYSTLALQNTYTRILNTQASPEEISAGGMQYRAAPITADLFARDLVREWVGDHQANQTGGNLGMMIIKGSEPLEEELASLNKAREIFCRTLVTQADDYDRIGKKEKIRDEHRKALKWLGSEDVSQHPWFREIRKIFYIPNGCPACGSDVPMTAFVCKGCHTNIAEYFHKRHKEVDPQKFPAIWEELQFLSGAVK
jgi:hypothetical protein